MTEYDFSPEAYEKYIAKQNSVARWVAGQAREATRYSSPFSLSPSEAARTADSDSPGHVQNPSHQYIYTQGNNLGRSYSTPIDPRIAHTRHRSSTAVTGQRTYANASGNTSTATLVMRERERQAANAHSNHHSHSHSSQSNPNSRSSSRTYVSASQTNGAAGMRSSHSRGHSYTHAAHPLYANPNANASTAKASYTSYPVQYTSAPNQPVIIPDGRQAYVVVPAQGARVQVYSPQSMSPTRSPAGSPTLYYPTGASPARSKKPGMFKRLFGGDRGRDHPAPISGGRRRAMSMHY